MDRFLYQELVKWKTHPSRLPVIVRGARQVGKSYLIEQFGEKEFEQILVVNFEKHSQFCDCFQSMEPPKILRQLELLTELNIQPGKTLLFLDEIQDCPDALKALRYFAEELPELHIIAAGSLLEFLLEDKKLSFPVGRVQFLNLGPLSFSEFLQARSEQKLFQVLKTASTGDEIPPVIHQRLLDRVREFFVVGGMPGVVSTFLKTDSFLEARRRQAAILELYTLDFGKYSTKHSEYRHLEKLFSKAPELIGKHFKYSKIDPESPNVARDYREAVRRLQQARLLRHVYLSQGNGLPLRAEKNEKKLKLFHLDIGLLNCSLGEITPSASKASLCSSFQGTIAEQFVAQELATLQDPYVDRELYYWENSARSSSAEIDFLVNLEQQRLPIEVKSGTSTRLKSLKLFMEQKGLALGVRISEHPLSLENGILSVPFYLIGELKRLIQQQ